MPNDDETAMDPKTEQLITQAFENLNQRAASVDANAGPHHQPDRGGERWFDSRQLVTAMAGALVAILAGVAIWQLLPSSGSDGDAVNVATDGETTDDGDGGITSTEDTTTDPAETTTGTDTDSDPTPVDDPSSGDRYRVDTGAVAADTADPFLNVRTGVGADQPLLAKLPPTYRGLAATGDAETTGDGATWIEVELLNPVGLEGPHENSWENPVGWVNVAFTLPLTDGIAVGTDEVPACSSTTPGAVGGSLGSAGFVYALESTKLSDNCLRVVLTVAAGSNPYFWDQVPEGTGPASGLPTILVSSSGAMGVTVDLGPLSMVWPQATETADDLYIARGYDRSVDLVTPVPVSGVHMTPIDDDGLVVIDLEVAGSAPLPGQAEALLDEPRIGPGTISVIGLARPFEATLDVRIVDDSGDDVSAIYSGSAGLGTMRSTQYGAQTNDWTDAWGRFAFVAEGLEPGGYTLLLVSGSGADEPAETAIAFTITEAGDPAPVPTFEEQAGAMELVRFANGGLFDSVPLADEVILALGTNYQETFTRTELENRANWSIDYEPFAGRTAPFDILGVLQSSSVRYSKGPIPHCAAPPLTWPSEWQDLNQINIEPVGIDSCIDWFGVSLLADDGGEVQVIVLDLWEP